MSTNSTNNKNVEDYPIQRNLDAYSFSVKRNGRFVNRCFTDLTLEEQMEILSDKDEEQLKTMVIGLAGVIRCIAYVYDISGNWGDSLD